MSSTKRRRYQNDYRTPTPVREPLIPLATLVARIERIRAAEGFGSRVRPSRSGRAQDRDERRASCQS